MTKRRAGKIVKWLLWAFFLGIILYAIAMFTLMGSLAKFSENIPPERIFSMRFGDPKSVTILGGGGESWFETDLWLAFRSLPVLHPDFAEKMQSCADAMHVRLYFKNKLRGQVIPEEMTCYEITNPNDATLAGRWLLINPKQGLHLYREWERGREF